MGRGVRHLAGSVAAALSVALAIPGSALGANGFVDGVTASEITAHSAILWARATHPGPVGASIGSRSGAGNGEVGFVVAGLRARKKDNNTVQFRIKHLHPNRTYSYQFCRSRHRCSEVCMIDQTLLEQGLYLEYLTLRWNVVGVVVG